MAAALLVSLLFWIAFGVVGWKLGDSKGRPGLGLALGLLLGIIGLVIVALLPSAKPHSTTDRWGTQAGWQPPPPVPQPAQWVQCPSCGQTISGAVGQCGYCHGAVRPSALLPPPDGTVAGWLGDPSGRYLDRYWDGERWTEWTRNGNDYLTDPPVPRR